MKQRAIITEAEGRGIIALQNNLSRIGLNYFNNNKTC